MSLYKQFWLFIILLLASAFLGSFIFSCIATRDYLQEQLMQKNNDSALMIALSLSSGDYDEVSMQLAISSQYDLGHYRFINFVDTQGNVIANHYDDRDYKEAPEWLVKFFPIEIKPGIASVTQGWEQLGTLTLSSHERFAYRQLWDNAKQLFNYFVLIALIFFVAGSVALRWLTKSLRQAVAHAEAVSERRFVKTEEPRTPELRVLIRSLNTLSQHVEQMLASETLKLEQLRKRTQYDEITGLYTRAPLLKHLHDYLRQEPPLCHGTLLLIRLEDVFHLNQTLGRHAVDDLLIAIGNALLKQCSRFSEHACAGRLNGSDFLLIVPTLSEQASSTTADIHQSLTEVCLTHNFEAHTLTTTGIYYSRNNHSSELLFQLDKGLQNAAENTPSRWYFENTKTARSHAQTQWPTVLKEALDKQLFSSTYSPIIGRDGSALHWSMTYALVAEEAIASHEFLPQVSKLGLDRTWDCTQITMALHDLKESARPLCIKLSARTLSDYAAQSVITSQLSQAGSLASQISIEFSEHNLLAHIEALRHFSAQLLPLGCKIGISDAGHNIEHIAKVHDIGLHYVKLDNSFSHELHRNRANQAYIRGCCTVLHTIGMLAIATGIEEEESWERLKEVGIDAGAGEFFKTQNTD